MSKQALKLKIFGRVQDVSYRVRARAQAQSLGLTGWVKNAPDGSVECWVQGSPDKLEQFLQWCWRGPTHAEVTEVKIEQVEPKDEFSDFKIVT